MVGRFYINGMEIELAEENEYMLEALNYLGAKFDDEGNPILKNFKVKEIDVLFKSIEKDWEKEITGRQQDDPDYSEIDFAFYDNEYSRENTPLSIDRAFTIIDECAIMSFPVALLILERSDVIEHKMEPYKSGERRVFKLVNDKHPLIIDLY